LTATFAGLVSNCGHAKKRYRVWGNLSEERKQELNRQLEGQLKPVLRPSDFDGFNLNEAFELVRNIIESLSL
jgi:hypothetical protein